MRTVWSAGNRAAHPGDHPRMSCDPYRAALSALLDGEEGGLAPADVQAHLGTCRGCTAWAEEVSTLHRMVRVREAERVPDLTAAILDRAPALVGAAASRRAIVAEVVSPARWALFVVALTQLVLAAPGLLLGTDGGATVHVARELGAFDVALATGLLVAAWQPARAWGLLPVVAALALVMGGTAVIDVVRDTASSGGEAHHLLDLAGVALLWWVARDDRSVASEHRRGRLVAS